MTITAETPSNLEAQPLDRVTRAAHLLLRRYLAERRERLTERELGKLTDRERQDLGLR